ncbi:hypothetical protein ACHAXT_005450 [Thalassiosira profunda]
MADPQPKPRIAVDPVSPGEQVKVQAAPEGPVKMQAYPDHRPPPMLRPKKPVGPQLWAVVFTLAGLYYLWTRVLGKSMPRLAAQGNRVGANTASSGRSSNNRQAEIQAARERQQQRLENAARAKEMVTQANRDKGNIRERTNVSSGNGSTLTIEEQARRLREQQQQRKKHDELEAKKKKQRQLYLKQKAEKEKEEEKKRKDEEYGPGWEYRQDPNAAASAINGMDPQSGNGSGGYKPSKRCNPRGGG